MNNSAYNAFEDAVRSGVTAYLEKLGSELEANQFKIVASLDADSVHEVDHDEERGWGIEVSYGGHNSHERMFLDVIVTDGDVRGFGSGRAGLLLECMSMNGEVVLSTGPRLFTMEMGASDPSELAKLIHEMPSASQVAQTMLAQVQSWSCQPPLESAPAH